MPRKRKSDPAQWNQRLKLIEEFCALDEEMSNIKPKVWRHQKLRELIIGWYPGAAAEEEITVPGRNSDIIISARDRIRSVTPEGKQKLYRLWGAKDFIAKSSVLLKNLPDPEDEDGLYTVQALTGPRHLHVVAKSRAAAEPAA